MSRPVHQLSLWSTACLALLAGTLAASDAVTQESSSPASNGIVRVELGGSGTRQLTLPKGKSAIIELPVDVRDILVTNPGVAQAALRTTRRVFLLGMESGQTDVAFFDAAGRRILSLDVRVDRDAGALQQTLARLLPNARIQVESINNSVVLTGMVPDAVSADHAVQIARRYVASSGYGGGSNTADNVINMLSLAGKDQVMLKVRIVEVQRSVIKQLGFNLNAVLNQVGEPQYLLGTAASFAVNGSLLGGVTAGYKLDTTRQPQVMLYNPVTQAYDIPSVDRVNPTATIQNTAGSAGVNSANATIQAFERVGLVRTLAEPNLTAVSGESAKFLAGGEYPVPVGQDNTGKVSIEFKPFGVGLGFTPIVLSGGRISLRLSTEVSELSNEGAFSVSSGNGSGTLTIPSLKVRRAESTVELPSGGSMMIAGLIQEQTRQSLDSLPGVNSLPVLGALFRSRDFVSGQTELVVIVTPYLVDASRPSDLQTPADGLQIASDAETLLMGKLNKVVKTPPGANQGRQYLGPHGYVIE